MLVRAAPLWLATQVAIAVGQCSDDNSTLPSLLSGLPQIRRDVRRWFRSLRKHAPSHQEAEQKKDQLSRQAFAAIPWRNCCWAEALCQVSLPANFELVGFAHRVAGQLQVAPGPHAIIPLCLGDQEAHPIWLVERRAHGRATRRSLPCNAFTVTAAADVAIAVEGKAEAAEVDDAVMVVPQGPARGACAGPVGYDAPFAHVARWACTELVTQPLESWQGILLCNYIVTNAYLALRGRPGVPKRVVRQLRSLSWRFLEFRSLPTAVFRKEATQDVLRSSFEELGVFIRTYLEPRPPTNITAPLRRLSTWKLVLRQTYPGLFKRNEWAKNADDPSEDNFAILDRLEQFRTGGHLEFKLSWPSSSLPDQRWRQVSNPVTSRTARVSGYEPLSVPHDPKQFGGLRHNNGMCLLDGSATGRNWFYAVGAFEHWKGGIPGPAVATSQVELYVRTILRPPKFEFQAHGFCNEFLTQEECSLLASALGRAAATTAACPNDSSAPRGCYESRAPGAKRSALCFHDPVQPSVAPGAVQAVAPCTPQRRCACRAPAPGSGLRRLRIPVPVEVDPFAPRPLRAVGEVRLAGRTRAPAFGLHTAGLAPEGCARAAEWALSARRIHLHVDGSEDCEMAVGKVLAGCHLMDGRCPFVSLAVRHIGPDFQVVVKAALQRLQLNSVDLLVLPLELAHRSSELSSLAPIVLQAGLGEPGQAPVESAEHKPHMHMWSPYHFLGKAAPDDIVHISSRPVAEFPVDAAHDPHMYLMAAELQRPLSVLLASFHLQQGYGVLVGLPGSEDELQQHMELEAVLPYAIMERIRALPTLVSGIAGQPLSGSKIHLNAYGLGDKPTKLHLEASVDNELMKTARANMELWQTSPCIDQKACAGSREVGAKSKCLLRSFKPSLGDHPPMQAQPNALAEAVAAWSSELRARLHSRLPSLRATFGATRSEGQLRYAVVDDAMPAALMDGLDAELQGRDLCEMLESCTLPRGAPPNDYSCGLHLHHPNNFMRICQSIPLSPYAQTAHRIMRSEAFVDFLQELSGADMLPSVEHSGGSYFETLPCGYIGLHEDASRLPLGTSDPQEDNRVARANVLLYLNDLLDKSTGNLELWSVDLATGLPGKPEAVIAPRRNRLVIFDTLDGIHGMPWPLKGGETRRALQWYYHQHVENEPPALSTITQLSVPCASEGDSDCYRGATFFW